MRYRRYIVTPKPDGSVTVWSHGPIVAIGSWLRLPLALVVGALLLPNYAKARKRSQGTAKAAIQRDAHTAHDGRI